MQTPTRILLIDDDAAHVASVRAAIAASHLDCTIAEAADGEAGLAEARREHFDCVLLNSRSADADVCNLVVRLASSEGKRQAVIALGEGFDEASALALVQAGAVDHVGPGDADNLVRAIRYAIARGVRAAALQAAHDGAEAKSRELDTLNRQKALILSILAHDLRNPLQVLLGMSEILADAARAGDLKVVVRRAEVVNQAAEQAHALIEGLFGWAMLYMDARVLEPTRVSLETLFSACAQGLQEKASDKGVAVEVHAGDLHALTQEGIAAAILRNLVANAIKFTPATGRVTISASMRGNRVALSVTDTGVGMTEAQKAGLFQRDRRATSTGTAGERGAGLGLLLCRDLCDWIGGEIEVESQAGAGATFRVLLPAGEAPL